MGRTGPLGKKSTCESDSHWSDFSLARGSGRLSDSFPLGRRRRCWPDGSLPCEDSRVCNSRSGVGYKTSSSSTLRQTASATASTSAGSATAAGCNWPSAAPSWPSAGSPTIPCASSCGRARWTMAPPAAGAAVRVPRLVQGPPTGRTPKCEALRLAKEYLHACLGIQPNCYPPMVINITDGQCPLPASIVRSPCPARQIYQP
jgi:hypothetical protein